MGTNYYAVPNRPSVLEPIHIGKSSIGWMFNFHDYEDRWHDPPIAWHTYEQVKDWLKKYTVDGTDYVIMDEYDRIVSFDELFEMIDRKQIEYKDNPQSFDYSMNVNGYRFTRGEFC